MNLGPGEPQEIETASGQPGPGREVAAGHRFPGGRAGKAAALPSVRPSAPGEDRAAIRGCPVDELRVDRLGRSCLRGRDDRLDGRRGGMVYSGHERRARAGRKPAPRSG